MLIHSKFKSHNSLKFNLLNIVFVCCVVLVFNSCASDSPTVYDNYDPLIWKARLALKDGNNSEALARFQEAFEVLPHDSTNDLFQAAEAALKVGKNDVAKAFIKTAFVRHNPDSTYYVSFFAPFKGEEIFDEIQAERPQLLEEYYANLPYPKEILDEIEVMLNSRQAAVSPEQRRQTDSINLTRLTEITRKHGWINRAYPAVMMYWVTDGREDEMWRGFKSAINDEIKKGDLRRSFWVRMDDIGAIKKNAKQIYGSISNFDKNPIAKLKNVDKKRAKVGLPPLWYMNRIHDHELPEGYTATNDDFLKSLREN